MTEETRPEVRPVLPTPNLKLELQVGSQELASMGDLPIKFQSGFTVSERSTGQVGETCSNLKLKNAVFIKHVLVGQCSPRLLATMQVSLKIARVLTTGHKQRKLPQEWANNLPKSDHFVTMYDLIKIGNDLLEVLPNMRTLESYVHEAYSSQHLDNVSIKIIRKWSQQLLEGVKCLQGYGISHRSVKLDHILVNNELSVKITCFDRSVLAFSGTDNSTLLLQKRELKSTRNSHLPPECFYDVYDVTNVDTFSTIVAMVTAFTNHVVFDPKHPSRYSIQWNFFLQKFLKSEGQRCTAEEAKLFRSFASLGLNPDPLTRKSATCLLKHQFIGLKQKDTNKKSTSKKAKQDKTKSKKGKNNKSKTTSQKRAKDVTPKLFVEPGLERLVETERLGLLYPSEPSECIEDFRSAAQEDQASSESVAIRY